MCQIDCVKPFSHKLVPRGIGPTVVSYQTRLERPGGSGADPQALAFPGSLSDIKHTNGQAKFMGARAICNNPRPRLRMLPPSPRAAAARTLSKPSVLVFYRF